MKKLILSTLIVCTLALSGCAPKQVTDQSGNAAVPVESRYEQFVKEHRVLIRPAVKAAFTMGIESVNDENEKKEIIEYAFVAALGVRSLMSGDFPTAEELEKAIKVHVADPPKIKSFEGVIEVIQELYKVQKKKFEDNLVSEAQASFIVLEEIARGVEEACLNYPEYLPENTTPLILEPVTE